jgi:hypothetical protein
VTGIIAQKSSFWKLENGLEIFDNFLKKLPEFEVPGMLQSGMVQSAAEFVLSFIPGLPKYLIRPLFHLVQKNSDVRNFCSTISTELKQIIATWKTNGDFKIAIVGLVESVLRSQPNSAERLAILGEIGQVLDQHADKECKKNGCLRLTKRAIESIPQFTALEDEKKGYAKWILDWILPQIFDRLLPGDRVDAAPEGCQLEVGGEATHTAQAPAGGAPAADVAEVQAVGVRARVASVMTKVKNAVIQVVQDVPPELQQVAMQQFVRQVPISERSRTLVGTLLNVVCFLPDEAHIGFRIYEFVSLEYRHGFLSLEVGAIVQQFQLIHALPTSLLNGTLESQALFQTATEPHIRRLLDQSEACGAVNTPAARLQIMANIHYLFHHEVCCFLRAFLLSRYCLFCIANMISRSAIIYHLLT